MTTTQEASLAGFAEQATLYISAAAMTAAAGSSAAVGTALHAQLEALYSGQPDTDAATESWLAAHTAWREAVHAHTAAIRATGERWNPNDRLRGLVLPTFSLVCSTYYAYMDAAAEYRRAHPLSGTEGAAYVAKTPNGFYEPVCPSHPSFRRVAWTHQRTPASSAREHNRDHHDGAPVAIVATDQKPSSLLP